MTAERFDMLSQMVGGLGLKVTAVEDIAVLGVHAEQVEPYSATRDDFIAFAARHADTHGYTERRARLGWNVTQYASVTPGDYPCTRFIDREEGRAGELLDLRSVANRLSASQFSPSAWARGTSGTVNFLRHLVDDCLHDQPNTVI